VFAPSSKRFAQRHPGRVPVNDCVRSEASIRAVATPETAFRLLSHLAILTGPSNGKGRCRLWRAGHVEEAIAADARAQRSRPYQRRPMGLLRSRSWTHWSRWSLASRVPARTVR